ncbi:4Fe-4S binding protein [Geothermobacter ehrlichii]|uniref:4Fe-4S binding protein n=1 Tax=Geothermobacter ehrlichii TaxID=213224 RepID=A0A5D3WI26_9BACT|nr:4Fe-4S binding protein [Geothermobacter ehrlichii]TYO97127.1 4Fe-4S binding protein [Geothermobacter ehrlichii]
MLSNLFDIPLLGRLLRARWFWRLLRLVALVLLLAMIAWGWHQHAIPGVSTPDPLMYTNITNHLFWVWWIMGVVFVALLLGRFWCAVCPLGWLNGIFARLGLRRELPGWLNNYLPVTLALVALQVAIYLQATHRYPDLTARLLALTVVLAIVCGLVFRPRAFCRLLCPAGAVFGLYARVAPFELRTRNDGTCPSCKGRFCVSGGSFWQRFSLGRMVLYWHARRDDCPMDLVPDEIRDSRDCTYCLHCVNNCPSNSIRLGFRRWMADIGKAPLPADEAFFLVVLFGLLTANFSKVYVDLRQALLWPPQQAALLLGWGGDGFNLLAAVWVALLLPLLLLLPAWAIWRLSETRVQAGDGLQPQRPDTPPSSGPGFWHRLGWLTLPLIPLLLAVHLVLALVKINAKAGYLPFALRDPSGVKSFLAINVMQTMNPPGLLLPLDLLKWLVLLALAGGIAASLHAVRRCRRQLPAEHSEAGYTLAALTALLVPAGLYIATVIRWLFIR